MGSPSELVQWVEKQVRRGATTLRLKVGQPRNLKVIGTVDLYEEKKVRSFQDVVEEVSEDLGSNGWPDDHPSWAVDAMSETEGVLKSIQGTEKAGNKATEAAKTTEARANRSDFEVVVDKLGELAFGYKDLADKLANRLVEADKQRMEAQREALLAQRAADETALQAREAALEAEAAAALADAAAVVEHASEPYEQRGMEALENLAKKFQPSKKDILKNVTKKDLIAMAKANPELLAELARDPEFYDALQSSLGAQEGGSEDGSEEGGSEDGSKG